MKGAVANPISRYSLEFSYKKYWCYKNGIKIGFPPFW